MRMGVPPTLDRTKFAKVCALYLSTTYAGERHAAFGKMERLAKAAGLTLEQAADLAIDARIGPLRLSTTAEATRSRSSGLVYRTAAQEKSTRIVDLLGIKGNGHPGYLRCYC